MKPFKTTTKLEQEQDLYFNLTDVGHLYNFGVQGEWIMKIMEDPTVAESMKLLNLLAMKNKMYPPVTPLAVFSDFDLEDCKMVIIGGTPPIGNLEDWTGGGYSYRNSSKLFTSLHQKFLDDFNMLDKSSCKPSLMSLRTSGALILYEVLSTTAEGLSLCASLWEPFIWKLLRRLSTEMPTVPIIFTSTMADAKFGSAVISSKHVFRCNLIKEKKDDGLAIFPLVQKLVNKGATVVNEIDIIKEMKR